VVRVRFVHFHVVRRGGQHRDYLRLCSEPKPLVARVFPGLIRGVDDTLHVCAARSNPVASPVSPCPMSIPFHKGNFSNSKSGSSVGRPVVTGDPDEDVDMVDFLRAQILKGGVP